MKFHPLYAALAVSIMLTACGGGGNVRPDPAPYTPPPPPPAPPTPPPVTPPAPPPPPAWSIYTDRSDNSLVPTGVAQARAEAGVTGKGVNVAVLDDQFYENDAYKGKTTYVDPTEKPSDDVGSSTSRGHGAAVVSIIAANPTSASHKGGIAPDASIYWGRICVGKSCSSSYAVPLVKDFVSKGVTLFNFSVGTSLSSDEGANKSSAQAWASVLKPLFDVDGLAVFSAVNESNANAGLPAAIPVYVPEYKNNILAVGAVTIGSDGKPTGLASYSNQCGTSAQWCMVAPGSHNIPVLSGTDFTGGGFAGTSAAAPAVTGVAALVSEKFPWMTGNNIQHTLLTTATDLGAPGVDTVYGWGMVNAAKAVKGPAEFYRTFLANTTGTSTFSNDISGSSGLVKSGSGTLILGGNNTYTGLTDVLDGTLVGKGNIAGSVRVDKGTFQAGGRVGGDYNATGSGRTAIQLGNTFQIGGTANLAGSLLLLPEASGYTVKTEEKLLQAAKVAGQFNNVTYANNFLWSARLSYTETEVNATMTRTSATVQAASVGLMESVQAGAGAIDAFIRETDKMAEGKSPASVAALAAGERLLSLNNAQAVDTFASVGGELYAQERTASLRQTSTGLQNLSRRAAGTKESGVWATAEASQGKIERQGYSNASFDKNAVSVGGALNEGAWTLGAQAQVGQAKLDINAVSGHAKANTREGAVFLKRETKNWYAQGVVGMADASVRSQREVIFQQSQAISSERKDRTSFARIEAGANLASGLKPYLAVEQSRHKQGAFTEQGQSGLELASGNNTFSVTFAEVGIRFDKDMNAWRISGDISYQSLISGRYPAFEAWFVNNPTATFVVDGQELSSSTIRAGLQAARKLNRNWSVTGGASFEKSSGRNSVTNGFVGLNYRF